MSLQALIRLKKIAELNKPWPDWVSNKNHSIKAFERINHLKIERLEFISTHIKPIDYKKRGNFQISASEVARDIGIATTTLISTSAYSPGLKKYLDECNLHLEYEKKMRLNTHLKTLSVGLRQKKKDEIRLELQRIREEIVALKKRNALVQAQEILSQLALPIKQKLGFDV